MKEGVAIMKKCTFGTGKSRGFRLEWDGRASGGVLYLFGVQSFGEYEEKRKTFVTGTGQVSVYGEGLTVQTYRSGCVEVCGKIFGVSLDREGAEPDVSD